MPEDEPTEVPLKSREAKPKGKATLALERVLRLESEDDEEGGSTQAIIAKWSAIKEILTSPTGKYLVIATALVLIILTMVLGAAFTGVGFHASKDGTITFGMPPASEPTRAVEQ